MKAQCFPVKTLWELSVAIKTKVLIRSGAYPNDASVESVDGKTHTQGRRRVLKSGTAIERHRRSARAECPSRGRAREGEFSPLAKEVRGISREKIFKF